MKYKFLWLALALLTACQNNNAQETDPTPTTTPTPKTVQLKLSFIGDIMGHGDQIKAAYDPTIKAYDYEPCFRYVRPLFEADDITIGNLELTTNSRGVYTGYPRFRSPDTLSHALKAAGFDFLVTANNHSNDDDAKGVIHTLDVLDAIKMPHTGTFRDSAERANTYPHIIQKEKDGVPFRIGIINCTYSTNGIPTQAPVKVNLIDTAELKNDIARLQAYRPDIIIAVIHWGNEYQLNESNEQRRISNFLYRQGVPVVIGGHPHVIQPIKIDTFLDNQKQKQTALCTYSLGNFISNQNQKNTDIGLLFNLTLQKNSDENFCTIADHSYTLLWRYIYNRAAPLEQRVYTVVPVSAFEQDTTNFLYLTPTDKINMDNAAKNMRAHLSKFQSKEALPTFADIISPTTLAPYQTTHQPNAPAPTKPSLAATKPATKKTTTPTKTTTKSTTTKSTTTKSTTTKK